MRFNCNHKAIILLCFFVVLGFRLNSVNAEDVVLFNATPISDSCEMNNNLCGVWPDINERWVFLSTTKTIYCDFETSAFLIGIDSYGNEMETPIIDNYITLNNDLVSLCTGGSGGNEPIENTDCFEHGIVAYYGDPIDWHFTPPNPIKIELYQGENNLTFKLWDYGAVYGNTKIVLRLPEHCYIGGLPHDDWNSVYKRLFFNRSANLDIFRQYRDDILRKSFAGNGYVNRLYDRSHEVALILLQNRRIMTQAISIADQLAVEVEYVLQGEPGYLSRSLLDEIHGLLKAMHTEAGPRLKRLIRDVQKDIEAPEVLYQFGMQKATD